MLEQSRRVWRRSALRARPRGFRSSAPHMSLPAHTRPRLCRCIVVFADKYLGRAARRAVPGGGDLWGDEKRSAGVGARTRALRSS